MPRKFVFQDFKASGCPESLFFKFFELRDSPKACFSDFSSFGTPRKLVFQIFRVSGAPDGSFSQKTTRRGIPKPYFSEFQPFGVPRSTIFPDLLAFAPARSIVVKKILFPSLIILLSTI